jgi:hypothetical protein
MVSPRAALMKKFQGLEIMEWPFSNLPESKSGRWSEGLSLFHSVKRSLSPLQESSDGDNNDTQN